MVTNVKMQVTPELSEMIQEIVFKNGGTNGFSNTPEGYMLINHDMEMRRLGRSEFKHHPAEQINPYDFIASQGEQKWLPKHGEEALFSDDSEEWSKRVFLGYSGAKSRAKFESEEGYWKYCQPLSKIKEYTIECTEEEYAEIIKLIGDGHGS